MVTCQTFLVPSSVRHGRVLRIIRENDGIEGNDCHVVELRPHSAASTGSASGIDRDSRGLTHIVSLNPEQKPYHRTVRRPQALVCTRVAA
jgi:hypothetical protein